MFIVTEYAALRQVNLVICVMLLGHSVVGPRAHVRNPGRRGGVEWGGATLMLASCMRHGEFLKG